MRRTQRTAPTSNALPGTLLPAISGVPRRQPPRLPTTPLIGRETDLARLHGLIADPDARIVTLLGPGGVGKTRLALTFAHSVAERFPQGVLMVRLDHVPTSSLAEAIGRHVSVTPREGATWIDATVAALREQDLLLLLDNCESLHDGMEELPTLLEQCPGIRVLATSQETLRLPDEHEVWLEPLALPTGEDAGVDPLASPAVRLLIQRAAMVAPHLEVDAANATTVLAIARRLDGLPLAIELAASYLRHLSFAEVLAMLDEAMPALGGGQRTLPDRHQSLRNLVRSSLDMLPPELRRQTLRLAVFPSGFTPRAVAAVIDHGSRQNAWTLLTELSGKSLVTRSYAARRSDARFHILQPIRSVLREELEATPGLLDETLERLAQSLARTAREADRHFHGPDGIEWLRRIRRIEADIAFIIDESRQRPALRLLALEIIGDLFWFGYSQGHYQWGLRRIEQLLDLVGENAPPAIRAQAHVAAGWFAHRMAQIERAERHFTAAGPLLGTTPSRSSLLWMIGTSYVLTFEEADTPEAIAVLQRVIELAPAVANAWHEQAAGHFGIGILRYFAGAMDGAREHLLATLRLGRAHDDAQTIGMALIHLAHVDRASGQPAEAFWKLQEAMPLLMELGDLATTALLLDIVAAILVELDAHALAMQALALGEHLRGRMSLPRSPLEEPDAAATRQQIDAWRAGAGADDADGSSLDLGETIDRLLRFEPPQRVTQRTPERGVAATVLSARELEVLHLVSTGMTSPEIAAALFVSPHTVKRHMANIREKLGVRSQAAAIAALRDLDA